MRFWGGVGSKSAIGVSDFERLVEDNIKRRAFRAIGVSKIKKSLVSRNVLKMTSKCLPCWMLLASDLAKSAFQKGTKKMH